MKFGHIHTVTTVTLAVLAALALVGSIPLSARPAVLAVVAALVIAQIVAVLARRSAGMDFVVLALALVHVTVATVLGGGAAFAIAFVGVAIVLPCALVLSHLRREVEGNYRQGARDRTGMPVDLPRILRSRRVVGRGFYAALIGLGAPVLAVTALVFLLFPRIPVGGGSWITEWLGGGDRIRFTDAIDLRGDGPLSPDSSVALRFTPDEQGGAPPPTMVTRFRGATLDTFDGKRWRRGEEQDVIPERRGTGRAILVERAAFDPPGVIAPVGTTGVTDVDHTGETSMSYVAWVGGAADAVDARAPTRASLERALALPGSLSPRLRALAHEWADGERSDVDKARAIERKSRAALAYDLATPSRAADDPLDDFVFVSKRGHCELFATAMAMMLRELGVPARVVTGFQGGRLNRFGGFYTVRQADAHAWVEALIANRWTTFDPTPPAQAAPAVGLFASAADLGDAVTHGWAPAVADYDSTSRAHVRARPYALAVLIVLAALALLFRLRLPSSVSASTLSRGLQRLVARKVSSDAGGRARADATALYEALDAALAARGMVRDASTPPLAHAEAIARSGHPLGDEILALTRLYLDARFGGHPLPSAAQGDARRRIEAIARVA